MTGARLAQPILRIADCRYSMDNAAPNQAVPEASDVRAPLPPSQPSSLLQAASRLFAWLKRPVLVAAELPDYRGPHAVGCYDFEWHPPAGHSAFRMGDVEEEGPKGEPLKPHSTVLVRLYYPCSSDASHARASWLPDPLYGKGRLNLISDRSSPAPPPTPTIQATATFCASPASSLRLF